MGFSYFAGEARFLAVAGARRLGAPKASCARAARAAGTGGCSAGGLQRRKCQARLAWREASRRTPCEGNQRSVRASTPEGALAVEPGAK